MNDAFFFIPDSITNEKHPKGSAPTIVDDLCELMSDAKEIWISMFLFNLPFFQKRLEDLVESNQAIVKIYTIPLEGYDRKIIKVPFKKDGRRQVKTTSKHEYAQIVHNKVRAHEHMDLYYFYHANLWNSQNTSRGKISYSLHNKSILFKRTDDSYMCISTSTNLALGDPLHSENMYVTSNDETVRVFREYFSQLETNSVTAEEYDDQSLHNDFKIIDECEVIHVSNETNCLFTAPFLKYQQDNQDPIGSNNFVYQKIQAKLESAQNRILVCTQHFNDFNPYDNRHEGLGEVILRMATNNSSLTVEILKQTLAEHQKQGPRAKQFEIRCKSIPNVNLKYWHPVIHDKFIIVDNEVIIFTANITPTQFAWSERHAMIVEETTHRNNFSDINSFHFCEDQNVLSKYEEHFNQLSSRSNRIT